MRGNIVSACPLIAILVLVPNVSAVVCSNDAVPAATLLFPFVVFDYNSPHSGATTWLVISNTGKDPQIVHITLWSDIGIAVLDFNIVLSGYDVQRLDMREILHDGDLPTTGTSGDLLVSPNAPPQQMGPVDSPYPLPLGRGTNTVNTIYTRCDPSSQFYPDYDPLPQSTIDLIRVTLTQSQADNRRHNDCAGNAYSIGDWFEGRSLADPTWMYVTATVVETCAGILPSNPQYWNVHARYDNVLMGDVTWADDLANSSEFDVAVHLEADLSLASTADTDYSGNPASFDYYHSAGVGATSDYREPLPTAWAMRYEGAGSPSIDTSLRVWKGPSILQDLVLVAGQLTARDCLAYTYYAWDEDEDVVFGSGWGYQPNLFPLRTQEVLVDNLSLVDSKGWVMFQWPRSNMQYGDADFYQTWMSVKYTSYYGWSRAGGAVALENSNCIPGTILQLLFSDGFESGDTSAWSVAVP